MQSESGLLFHAIHWVITLIHGQAACCLLQNCFLINIQFKTELTYSWEKVKEGKTISKLKIKQTATKTKTLTKLTPPNNKIDKDRQMELLQIQIRNQKQKR